MSLNKIIQLEDSTYRVEITPIGYDGYYSVLLSCDTVTASYVALFNRVADAIVEFIESNDSFAYIGFTAVDERLQFAPTKSKFFTLIGQKVAKRTDKISLLQTVGSGVQFARK